MIIQHNISALNSYRNLSMNNNSISGNLEKLSSGYRINRAGDDAAGLAISEKMRAQITGLETAQANAEDGISLVQTAEGALTEVHTMLNRMVELAQQSSNGTIQNEVDRENIQAEVDALTDEIDRISKSTNFNGINLLDGSMGRGNSPVVEVVSSQTGTGAAIQDVLAKAGDYTMTTAPTGTAGKSTFVVEYELNGKTYQKEVEYTEDASDAGNSAKSITDAINADEELNKLFTASQATNGVKLVAKQAGTEGAVVTNMGEKGALAKPNTINNAVDAGVKFTKAPVAGDVLKIDGVTYKVGNKTVEEENIFSLADLANHLKEQGYKLVNDTGADTDTFADNVTLVRDTANTDKQGLKLQIGDTSDDFNQITVSIGAMDTKSLNINEVDLSTQEGAQAAVDVIKKAINTVSSQRGDLGAIQNRLEHTINNLGVTAENMTAAESRIRDVDMAKEMMEYTKNNILIQSSQAMLAQANQLPQGVLQLLQ